MSLINYHSDNNYQAFTGKTENYILSLFSSHNLLEIKWYIQFIFLREESKLMVSIYTFIHVHILLPSPFATQLNTSVADFCSDDDIFWQISIEWDSNQNVHTHLMNHLSGYQPSTKITFIWSFFCEIYPLTTNNFLLTDFINCNNRSFVAAFIQSFWETTIKFEISI